MSDAGSRSHFKKRIGLFKSIAIYYWKPFNQYRLRKFYSQFIHAGDLCFDVGAHVGNRTQAWHALRARVIAVEPQPECVAYLKRRFAGQTAIEIIDKAVGRSPGPALMHVSSANPTISTLSDQAWRQQLKRDARYPIEWDEDVPVQMTTLDALIARFGIPAFCKLDVENAEYEALLGLSRALPQLSFEYYPPAMENTFRCLDRLEVLGTYEYNWSFGESLRLRSDRWLTVGAMVEILQGYSTRRQYGDIYARILR